MTSKKKKEAPVIENVDSQAEKPAKPGPSEAAFIIGRTVNAIAIAYSDAMEKLDIHHRRRLTRLVTGLVEAEKYFQEQEPA